MLEALKVIILGIVQGITEWLPIKYVQCSDPVWIDHGSSGDLFP